MFFHLISLSFDLMHLHFIFCDEFYSQISDFATTVFFVGPLSISDIAAASDDLAKVRISYQVWSWCVWCCLSLFDLMSTFVIICLDYWFRGYQDHTARMLHLKLTLIVKQSHAVILKRLLRFDIISYFI